MDCSRFNNRLSALMESNGMNQRMMAIECGLPFSTLCRYLNTDREPTLKNLLMISERFRVSSDWLVGLSEDKAIDYPAGTLYPPFEDMLLSFRSNVQALMDSKKFTNKDLSEEIRIPEATIGRYLNGERIPRTGNVAAIAAYFEVRIDWLLGLTERKSTGLPPEALDIARLYAAASPDDRLVVETVLGKYRKEGKQS